jgi:DNA invertase Pin-like site-specific DNA recombinase
MLAADAPEELREAHGEFERLRGRVWLERVRVGLEYRRAMRGIDEGVARARLERDLRVREAVAAGASYREVAAALGLSHSRVQQIVNEGGGREALVRERAR